MAAIATVEAEAEAPVISAVPVTPQEIAELATSLANVGTSAITGQGVNGVDPRVSSYAWNLTNDFNVNWRTTGPPPGLGTPAAGHRPSLAQRDLQTVWTPPPPPA